jgi:hypothetical protein
MPKIDCAHEFHESLKVDYQTFRHSTIRAVPWVEIEDGETILDAMQADCPRCGSSLVFDLAPLRGRPGHMPTAIMRGLGIAELHTLAFDASYRPGVRKRAMVSYCALYDNGRMTSKGCTWENGEIVGVPPLDSMGPTFAGCNCQHCQDSWQAVPGCDGQEFHREFMGEWCELAGGD